MMPGKHMRWLSLQTDICVNAWNVFEMRGKYDSDWKETVPEYSK